MKRRVEALAALTCAASIAGCASLLGGLEEAAPPADAGRETAEADGGETDARCGEGLAGFRYRVGVVVKHSGPAIRDYQVKLTLPTSSLVASGKMRADGADIRVTTGDGITALPHWIEGGLGTNETTVWTRLDLTGAGATAWLYYGSEHATDESSLSRTFASAIVDDPQFDDGDAWYRAHEDPSGRPSSTTNEWSATLGSGKATVRLISPGAALGNLAGICQTMFFPGGSSYRFAFDLNVTLADHGSARLAFDGLGGAVGWSTTIGALGHFAGESTPFAAGPRTVCFAVVVEDDPVGRGVEGTFSGLRVRRVTQPEPTVVVNDVEEDGCP
jgi:hypothetical protein